ncbi:MAG: hypothetical protein Q7U54_04395 [Bacteroidales bacterium]|nr:hypothetical protein [Bacteroidales bacterium]
MKKTLVLLIATMLTATLVSSQTNECCDSLIKIMNVKKVKTTSRKLIQGQNPDITISIDNSHNSNNCASSRADSLKIQNPTIKIMPEDDGFKWWDDFFKPILQLLIALVPLFILVFKYLTQKQKEYAERIIASKRLAYSEFLGNFTDTAVKIMYDKNVDNMKQDRERMFARNQLLLYANDKVIQAYHAWIEYADKETKDINREVDLFGKVLIEIRKDIHGDSKVTEQEISNLNPFNRG